MIDNRRTADDARRNPKPGDVFSKENCDTRIIDDHCYGKPVDGFVRYRRGGRGFNQGYRTVKLSTWREWAATAEVLKVAE